MNRRDVRRRVVLSVAIVLCATGLASGQETAEAIEDPVADPADVASVEAIIDAVYDVISGPAGAERDWDRMRTLFLPDAKLIPSWRTEEGEIGHRYMSLDEWIDGATGYFAENPFFEVEISRVDERYGHIAHAFSTYESRTEADGPAFTRGINSIQLMNDGERWWIVNIFWQGESDAEPIPSEYLP